MWDDQTLISFKEEWEDGLSIITATDGGLGNKIGSCGYIIVFDGEEKPTIQGYACC